MRTVRLNLTRSGSMPASVAALQIRADEGPVGEQVAVDFLADHVRALGPQYPPGAAQLLVLSWAFPVSCVPTFRAGGPPAAAALGLPSSR